MLKLLPSEVAAKDCSAAGVHPVGEPLAGDADALAFPVLQLPFVDVVPLLNCQYVSSAAVLAGYGLTTLGF